MLGRCAGEKFLRRLEDGVRVLGCLADFTGAVAELLERVEKAGSVVDVRSSPGDRALLRYAGVRLVVTTDDKEAA